MENDRQADNFLRGTHDDRGAIHDAQRGGLRTGPKGSFGSQPEVSLFFERLHEYKTFILMSSAVLAVVSVWGCRPSRIPERPPPDDRLAYLYKRHGLDSPF